MQKPKSPLDSSDLDGLDLPPDEMGDTKSLAGFVRLVEFIKKEHYKKKLAHQPEFHVRLMKIEKYAAQKDDPDIGELKKGLQLKKAA
ncbi:MAG: hypothetical protein KF681_16495 [Bdellovibrionaceae bacterium]|nr:hypothetical protein [Pseudobdellovibrionaceae bacterium]